MEAQSAPLDVIERQEWLEPVEEGLQNAVTAAYESAGESGQAVKNFLHGTWLGHPLHPVLTDIPLGSWTAGAVLDILDASGDGDYAAGADAALTVGLVGAAGAAITGLTDWQSTYGKARRIGVVHGMMNLTSAGLYTASLVCRKRGDRSTGRLLSFLGYAISLGAAYLGGHLVYAQKVGVKHLEDENAPEDWTGVLTDSELAEGQMRKVEAKGFPVLLARQGGRIQAIAETCSHMGGPLAEGKMEGDTVRCPWHGSRFSLADGSVIDGPATMPQTCFETRVQNGQIEVRARRE